MAVNLRSPLEVFSIFKLTTRERWDIGTPLIMATLSAIGIAFIYSAQFSTSASSWIMQGAWLALGAMVYVVVSLIDYRFWLSVNHLFYGLCLILLVLVLIPGVGTNAYGAQRWLRIGPVGFQPSDPAKAAVLLMTASILMREKVGGVFQSLGVLGKLALAVGIPIFLILLQPDLKSFIVLPPMVFSMLYVSRLSTRFFVAALGAFAVLIGIIAWDSARYINFMEENNYSFVRDKGEYEPHSLLPFHDYQRNRIISFTNPDKIDPMGISWNQRQSLISVGSGGLLGKGWTEGTQAQLGYLPRAVAHNDFIFSVIAEEKGLLGSLTVLSLFGLMLFNGIRIAGLARDSFGTLLALGVTVLFAVHVFVNIAMTIGLVPITGIPLPFISYGGSFVLSCCLLQGLVQSVYRFRKDFT
ncbi:FtsW/RodA/SpoVE family cell cycle protein [Synoicihabitans lomoniglobus]|uniref:FtsW/RodA/SpoVE family cell cycle protein n=1 Tax=Synoicihabitans lomoniglobus TaxID=2909285 RepID=A0AAE9ZYA2_9BACT|nr:rod shape-determining protein RodA [Opitutaceae bacterium LMO-M01]WED65245.1 FtsW/RodA/SpoVE family cell cycle protein [Opitutaceae bacterium LMO-M01]